METALEIRNLLRESGFTKAFESRAGGNPVKVYIKELSDRRLEVQIWSDGEHRVSHFHNRLTPCGCQCTLPTYFYDVEQLHSAIAHESTRSDFRHGKAK